MSRSIAFQGISRSLITRTKTIVGFYTSKKSKSQNLMSSALRHRIVKSAVLNTLKEYDAYSVHIIAYPKKPMEDFRIKTVTGASL